MTEVNPANPLAYVAASAATSMAAIRALNDDLRQTFTGGRVGLADARLMAAAPELADVQLRPLTSLSLIAHDLPWQTLPFAMQDGIS